MPSTSPAQAKLMRAVAHGWHKPGGGGPSEAVAKEFVAADKKAGKYFGGGTVSNTGYAKGGDVRPASYAQGGAVLGRTGDWKKTVPNRGFLDTPDRFTDGRKPQGYPAEKKSAEEWGKGSSKANPKAVDKSEKAITPRT